MNLSRPKGLKPFVSELQALNVQTGAMALPLSNMISYLKDRLARIKLLFCRY